jgi:lysophospholipase L1-like esterase
MENLARKIGKAAWRCATKAAEAVSPFFDRVSRRSILLACQLAIFAFFAASCSSPPEPNQGGASGEVGPGDEHIHYEGRIDWHDPQQPSMSFPGSALAVHFRGTGFEARFSTTIADHIQVVIDGKPTAAFAVAKDPALYPIASDLPAGEHTAILYKCTESNRGTLKFYGLRLAPGTRLLSVPRAKRNIEFIGDSITAGYGDMAANQHEPVSPENSNWYYTYGAITAREFGAEQVTVAVSGIRLTQSGEWDAMPRVYRRVHPNDHDLAWDFKRGPVPDVVVIDLATNDFRMKSPSESEWTGTFGEFLDFVRSHRPSAEIYIADGPLMSGTDVEHLRAWNREVVAQRKASGDGRCHTISFPEQLASDGYGSDFHPNVKTQMKMAERLVAAIRADTGW